MSNEPEFIDWKSVPEHFRWLESPKELGGFVIFAAYKNTSCLEHTLAANCAAHISVKKLLFQVGYRNHVIWVG